MFVCVPLYGNEVIFEFVNIFVLLMRVFQLDLIVLLANRIMVAVHYMCVAAHKYKPKMLMFLLFFRTI